MFDYLIKDGMLLDGSGKPGFAGDIAIQGGKIAAIGRIDAAAARVAPGGQLVYSTCSIEPEENEQQAERFLAEHPDFTRMASEQLLPSVESDGAYACLLRRSAQSMPT